MSTAAAPFEDRQAKVEEVLRGFATTDPPCPNRIPYSFLIPGIARELVWAARSAPPTVPRKAAKAKHQALKKAAAALADLLADPSLAVEFPLEERLWITRIAHSEVALNGQRGIPRKDAAERIARFLAEHFKGLTGVDPGRSTSIKDGVALPTGGRFIQLLDEIYGVLGINASADSQARAAIKAMEKNSSKI
jgi:hypothetical protein